jgi:predicted RNA-binding protein with PIN domain
MILIIDGHNLIPKVPGMQLSDMDDESQLVEYVREYCRRKRARAELFFDGAPAGSKPASGGGMVHIHYVRKGSTADAAMIDYLGRQEKNARNFTLVSSDRRIQAEARALGCGVFSSDQFAVEMINALSQVEVYSKENDQPLKNEEVEKWLEIFSKPKK